MVRGEAICDTPVSVPGESVSGRDDFDFDIVNFPFLPIVKT